MPLFTNNKTIISILDYKIGNIHSIQYSLDRMGINTQLTFIPSDIKNSDALILPGVGNATTVMNIINKYNLKKTIFSFQKPIMGICLGMQILCQSSEENNQECLGIFPYKVKKIQGANLKVPQMGWNTLQILDSKSLVKNLLPEEKVYYANSFYVERNIHTMSITHYGDEISAEIQKDNFWGLQFHPEKSGKVGQKILKNFLHEVKKYKLQ